MQNILSTKMKEYEVLLKVVKEAEEKDRHKMASINKQQQYL